MNTKHTEKGQKLVFLDYEEEKARSFKKSPKLKAAYDELGPVFAIIDEFIKLRLSNKITQKQLEALADISQTNISRFENKKSRNFTFSYLTRLVRPLGYQPRVVFEKVH